MRILAFTVSFVMAFLLFSVQPMATKMVLPSLGGTPAVWNTAMLTFQLLLLAGYGYAHALSRHVPVRLQWLVHTAVIAASCAFLPLHVVLSENESLVAQPIRHLVAAFVLQVGLPFFVLSATAPLLQRWVSRSDHPLAEKPYVLYSASNLGSMLGLLGYVAFVEPHWNLSQQSQGWSVLYIGGALALLILAVLLKPEAQETASAEEAPRLASRQVLLWIWLAFLSSSLSLSLTSYITTDIAAVPLFWVVPLALYLLSFVDAFRERPLLVGLCIRAAPLLGMLALMVYAFQGHRFVGSFLFQLLAFFALALALHGWLARFKPPASQLTAFYFFLSIGGALGGVLNALVAPLVFTDTLEYPLSLLAASLSAFCLWASMRNPGWPALRMHLESLAEVLGRMAVMTVGLYVVLTLFGGNPQDFRKLNGSQLMMAGCFAYATLVISKRRYIPVYYATGVLCVIMLVVVAVGMDAHFVFRQRNFFGVWKVFDKPADHARFLMHNTTVHSAEEMPRGPQPQLLSYYHSLAEARDALPVVRSHPIAAVGLGAGTVACLAQPKQQMDIFEIDPLVPEMAHKMFGYLDRCPGKRTIILGDGRIMLDRQPEGKYGAVILDAFSSDSIPAHLMTLEALRSYGSKLAPHGVLLIHTTNRHIDLWPLLATQAEAMGYVAYGKFFDTPPEQPLIYKSFWVVMAKDGGDIEPLLRHEGWQRLEPDAGAQPWTDEYVNLLPYLKVLRAAR